MRGVFHDRQYLQLLSHVFEYGQNKLDRTGTGTISVFGYQMRFDISDGTIPLLTTKKMPIKSIIHEILWYLSGATNIKYLTDNKVTIWDEWAYAEGELGPVYGKQWRRWSSPNGDIDQLQYVIDTLRTDPSSRRLLVSAWNVGDLHLMALPPCHYAFQFYTSPISFEERCDLAAIEYSVTTKRSEIERQLKDLNIPSYRLSCMLNQRSCDVGLGVPFNIAQYSILTRMIAHVVGMLPGEFIWSGGDVHIYKNHVTQLKEQANRGPYPSPTLDLNLQINNIDDFTIDDFTVNNYRHHGLLKMEVSV
jgi:thymidylate synthase